MTDNLPAIITSNGVDVTPVFKEMIDYLKLQVLIGS